MQPSGELPRDNTLVAVPTTSPGWYREPVLRELDLLALLVAQCNQYS